MKKKTADQKGLPTFKKMIHRMINNQIILMKLLRFKGKNFSRHPHRKKKNHIQGKEVRLTSYFPRITFNARR